MIFCFFFASLSAFEALFDGHFGVYWMGWDGMGLDAVDMA